MQNDFSVFLDENAAVAIQECERLLAEERRRREDQSRRNFTRGALQNGNRVTQVILEYSKIS